MGATHCTNTKLGMPRTAEMAEQAHRKRVGRVINQQAAGQEERADDRDANRAPGLDDGSRNNFQLVDRFRLLRRKLAEDEQIDRIDRDENDRVEQRDGAFCGKDRNIEERREQADHFHRVMFVQPDSAERSFRGGGDERSRR